MRTFSQLRTVAAAAGILAATAFGVTSPASAANTELAIVIDDAADLANQTAAILALFAAHQNAYANALKAVLPLDGSKAIEVIRFSSNVQVEFPLTVIDDAADLANSDGGDFGCDADRHQYRDR